MKLRLPPTPIDNPGAVYRRLLGYTLKYWRTFALAVLAMVLLAGTETALVWLMKPLLDGSFVERDPAVIRWIPFAFLLAIMARGVFSYLSGYWMNAIGRYVIHDLRGDLFNHYLRLPIEFYDRSSSAELLTKLIYHVEQVAQSATSAVTTIVREGLTAVALLCLMFYLSWELSLIVLVVAPVVALIVRVVSRRFRKISTRIQNSMSDVNHVGSEVITGHRVVKIFGAEQYEQAHFAEVNDKNTRLNIRMGRAKSYLTPIVQFVIAIAVAVVIYIITRDKSMSLMTPGTFVSFAGAMMGLMSPIRALTTVNATLQTGIAAAASIFALLDTPTEPQGGSVELVRARGAVSFEKVSFRYPGSERTILQDINLQVEPGRTVAFVGRSGAGKSTLLSLLPRFYDPTAGCIRLDGHDIRELRLQDLRRQIAFVPQNVTLFNDTIARNIAYGDMAGAPEEQIIEAAKNAYAWEFIELFPDKLNTLVGQNGVLLSGGQRQRLAIARALLKNAPVLILDEATSALDTESECKIQQALEYLMKRCTTLVIAHRLSTIQNADLIVVMDQGRVVEQGGHSELLEKGGQYAALHAMQFRDPD
ncbi:MAG TPA: lipid A export permease/ATP-binding protein MsbA [Nevskiales bacterium]|nr:lipid A export permease/ATP-binding protein MsbA [Nevskiales bacterium]